MKLKFFLLALLGVISTVQAQNSGTVSGKITEKSNNAPISYATVSIKDNGKVVSGVNTDDNGDFTFKNLALKVIQLKFNISVLENILVQLF